MTIAIIDGDVVAYYSCPSRYVAVNGQTLITLKGQEPVFTEEQDQLYLENAWIRAQEIIKDLAEVCFANEIKVAVKGNGNFRDSVSSIYKAHRKDKEPHKFVPTIRNRLVEAGIAIAADGMEADDYLRMWQQEALAKNENYIICSIDKDLKCIPGRHYNMKHKNFFDVSDAQAIRFYYEQLLQGDSTDNIKGIPGIGPKTAAKLLADANEEEQFKTIVIECYQAAFSREDWKEQLLVNGKLITLKKTMADEFSIEGWPEVEYVETEITIASSD